VAVPSAILTKGSVMRGPDQALSRFSAGLGARIGGRAPLPTASLRSLLLICIFKAALACLASMQMTGIRLPESALNRGGGGLARGHPIGASGAILAVRLWHEMQSCGGRSTARKPDTT
jgi:hypothetical protein